MATGNRLPPLTREHTAQVFHGVAHLLEGSREGDAVPLFDDYVRGGPEPEYESAAAQLRECCGSLRKKRWTARENVDDAARQPETLAVLSGDHERCDAVEVDRLLGPHAVVACRLDSPYEIG